MWEGSVNLEISKYYLPGGSRVVLQRATLFVDCFTLPVTGEKASGPSISVIDPPSHKSGFKMSNWQNRNYDNYLRTINLGARWAPISSWWPSATLFGPSGLLDFLFHALRALKPCFVACEGGWVKNVTE